VPEQRCLGGRIPIRGAYQLVSDNLLDLSHTQYLHPVLTVPDDPDTSYEYDILQDGDTITTVFNTRNLKPISFVTFIWPDAPQRLDSFSGVRWQAPANMLLKIHFVSLDPTAPAERRIWGAELITPETDTSCHYFWATARDFRQNDEAFGKMLGEITEKVFTDEDGAMIAEVQDNMGDAYDLIALHPVVLPTDQAAIRARMILKKLIKQEERDASAEPA